MLLCLFQIQLQLQVGQCLLKDTEGFFFLFDPWKVTQIQIFQVPVNIEKETTIELLTEN